MHKKAAFGVGLLLLAAPVFTFAQSADVLAQIQSLLAQISQLQALLVQLQGNSGVSATACVNLTHSIGPDDWDSDTGGDVSRLQKFLTTSGVYSGSVSGHVGPATVQAIQKWQSSHSLVSSGDPDSTGYGYVG
ncbi:peptidoglycan-binding protein, partial [Candidatus Kaiserbacteria bacterium]|nr:peptidoglycan-binding protein [Candidatus Kaiserbacteria bacterium]